MVGYRCENVSSGKHSPLDAIMFEICELNNTDIIDYCLKHYDEIIPEKIKQPLINIKYDKDMIMAGERVCPGCSTYYVKTYIESMLNHLSKHFGIEFTEALWLCKTAKDVKEQYCTSDTDDITAYNIDLDKCIIIIKNIEKGTACAKLLQSLEDNTAAELFDFDVFDEQDCPATPIYKSIELIDKIFPSLSPIKAKYNSLEEFADGLSYAIAKHSGVLYDPRSIVDATKKVHFPNFMRVFEKLERNYKTEGLYNYLEKHVSFENDDEKMKDFYELSKEDFLNSYSYLTEFEYEATKNIILSKKEN